jgi:hypothetical protein
MKKVLHYNLTKSLVPEARTISTISELFSHTTLLPLKLMEVVVVVKDWEEVPAVNGEGGS